MEYKHEFPVKISILDKDMEAITRFFTNSAIAGPLSEYVNRLTEKKIKNLEQSIEELKKRVEDLEKK